MKGVKMFSARMIFILLLITCSIGKAQYPSRQGWTQIAGKSTSVIIGLVENEEKFEPTECYTIVDGANGVERLMPDNRQEIEDAIKQIRAATPKSR
jgi:hypothetical protein